MKQKVLFMIINMNIGGTEKALLNLLEEFPENKFEVTILMLEKNGGFLSYIPEYVKIEVLDSYQEIKPFLNLPPQTIVKLLINKGRFLKLLNWLPRYLVLKLFNDPTILFKWLLKEKRKLPTEFDVAVAYAGPMDFISFFIGKKVNAKRKYQWIHFDVTKIGFNKFFAAKIYKQFTKIFTVSEEGKNKLSNLIPNSLGKIDVFHNVIHVDAITKMAEEDKGYQDDFKGTRILTVGRLSKEKGQDMAIKALGELIKEGYNLRWYCIGEGNARKDYEEQIKKLGLENEFILLGSKANPYPYMKDCDLYVQPSRHEGFCITLAEAKVFNKPIICTTFTGAKEQIIHNYTGLLVNNYYDLYNAIKNLMQNKTLMEKYEHNLKQEKKNKTYEIELRIF
ncbi:glycosyltransferase [Falsibacillus pallidus]|uniref:Glycosyltransferase involved in cell wall biosynthesis n=1 Tax=Falsibacillus pallidus TaxID=493781 RepID=A0A370GPS3_9BACI|nr:glycosyltransferase [Falsibacillus pallidus]RDI45722.1 glycosyltransferase involved in cell wall biosynthesis [Falsibacillus pallidus]